MWITTHWKVANDLSIEKIPGRASQRSGELVYCTWYEPRRTEPGAWMHFSDVEPRDTTRRRPTEQR